MHSVILQEENALKLTNKTGLVNILIPSHNHHLCLCIHWDLDHKEGWRPKNCWFWIVVLEKTLESPLDSKEIKVVNPKRNQPWVFIGRPDEAPILWPPDAKSRLIGKDPDAGKDWRWKEKTVTEDEMVELCHQFNEHVLKLWEMVVMDREAWHVAVHGIAKNQTWLSDWTTTMHWEHLRSTFLATFKCIKYSIVNYSHHGAH